ncbi:MAG TPA: GNAT family N-acetyltransferase [Devosiaceae bacterium]|nr:GNAT family N-acetyltransferase [Devosiaceae bacterium]
MTADVSIRPARKSDASDIALLVNIATHGGIAQGWANREEAAGTYDPIEVGRQQVLADDETINWRNATMAEIDGEVAGMLLGYPEPEDGRSLPDDIPAFLLPLYELEAEAAGHWFISMLGVYVPWRSHGVGSKLLEIAEGKRLDTGRRGLALISDDTNEAARRLYERRGFKVTSTRPKVKFPQGGPQGKDWLLMVKE